MRINVWKQAPLLIQERRTLLQKRGSFFFDDGDEVGYGAVAGSFRVVGEVAGREFGAGAVVVEALAADSFSAAAERTIAMAFVAVDVTGFVCHGGPLTEAYHQNGSFAICGNTL
jgi:phage baseplate assembly protein gpV